MADPLPLTSDWLRANPVPPPATDADKNARGRVLAIGGGAQVPGGILLTAEAALRAGAGKVRIAVPRGLGVALGMAMPEAGIIALAESAEGEIAGAGLGHSAALAETLSRSDAIVAGPAMSDEEAAGTSVDAVLSGAMETACLILDAAALMGLRHRAGACRSCAAPLILTPHIGEMAALMDCSADEVDADRAAAARQTAEHFGAVVVLKGAATLIAAPDGRLLGYAGGGVGLATGGSGDVQAGLAAGLAARGADPLIAACWAVWLHGEAGRRCAEQTGPLGFLARELLAHVPALLKGI